MKHNIGIATQPPFYPERASIIPLSLWPRPYRNKKYIKVGDNDIEKELLTVDILYIEVYSHQIVIHTLNKHYYQKGKLGDYEKMLEGCLFVRSDKSVLINITNIDYIKKKIQINKKVNINVSDIVNIYM